MTKISALKKGDVLIADDGFTCLKNGERVKVGEADGELFVPCKDGKHFLAGQTDDGDTLTGLSKPPTRRDLAKAATYQKVLEAAAGLFAAEGGYEAATIRSIAKAAGMSTGAVFANFPDKAALYRAIYGHAPISPEQGRELLGHLRAVLQIGTGTVASDKAVRFLGDADLLSVQAPEVST